MSKRILVIENDPFILELLTDLVTRFGYSVERAPSGSEALTKLADGEFDGILLDIHLYDMDGREVYQKIKVRSFDLARRTVFVTGDLGNPQTASFIQETGNLCLQKPFTVMELKAILKRSFEEKNQ